MNIRRHAPVLFMACALAAGCQSQADQPSSSHFQVDTLPSGLVRVTNDGASWTIDSVTKDRFAGASSTRVAGTLGS